ncbi:MAG TPA: WD40 repeat domain-containing protein, partial [Candidatus Acidoferrum sp.]|nr:WD40 repeat domain-containing protein [Candidatus Acidoferrum sp.]
MLPLIEVLKLEGDDSESQRAARQRLSATLQLSPRLVRLWDARGTPVQLQFSSDGKRLIAVLRSGEPRVWDLATREPVLHPDVKGRDHRGSFISPDGSQVLEYFTNQPFASLWKIAAKTFQPIEAITDRSEATAFSPDGKLFATGGESVRLWDTDSCTNTGIEITNATRCLWLMFSPDGQQLLTGHEKNEAWRWNIRTGERLNETPIFSSSKVLPRFSAGGEQLLVNSTGRVHVVNWATGAAISSVPAGNLPYEMNFAPDGRQFAVAGFGDQARVWETETGQPFRLPMTHESGANKVVFSPDGALLATAGFDYQLRVVRAENHRPVLPAIHHSALIEAVAFSLDSRFLAVGDVEGVVQVWDLQSGAQPFLTSGEAMRRVAHMEDGTRIVLEDAAGALHVYDLQTGAEIGQSWNTPPNQSHFSADPNGRFISGAFRQNGVRIWDASTHEVVHEIPARAHPATRDVRAIVFKHDGSEFVTMMANGLLQRWSTGDGSPIGESMNRREPTVKVYWSADGRWIAANGVNSVTVWDAKTGAMFGTIRVGDRELLMDVRLSPDSEKLLLAFGNRSIEPAMAHIYELPSLRPVGAPLRHGDGIANAVFSSAGKLVATAGEDNVVRIWRVSDGQPVTGALRHKGTIGSVLFSHDDRLLATACADGMIRLWDVARGEVIGPPVQLGGQSRLICFTPGSTRLFAQVDNPKPSIWSITLAPKDVLLEKLQILAECQSGFRADVSKGATPLSATELAAKFSMLRADDTVLPSTEDILRWHAENAIIAERRGEWFTVVFHLQRLV